VVCLNARRETRKVPFVTNVVVSLVTNATVATQTNQTVSAATNFLFTAMTNLAPVQPGPPVVLADTTDAAPVATNTLTSVDTNAAAAVTTNFTLSVARNQSATVSPNQTAANTQSVRTLNNQITTTSNNLSISVLTNLMVTMETNQVLSYLTNLVVMPVTNVIILPTNEVVHDYFLYTELLAPPDFSLASGESLVLLVDGVRWGFSPGQSGTLFVGRKGYSTTLYKVPPETIVALANAKQARLRIKGVNSVIERKISGPSRAHFRTFLLRYFKAEAPRPKAPRADADGTAFGHLASNTAEASHGGGAVGPPLAGPPR
jgi:hypothetical protein